MAAKLDGYFGSVEDHEVWEWVMVSMIWSLRWSGSVIVVGSRRRAECGCKVRHLRHVDRRDGGMVRMKIAPGNVARNRRGANDTGVKPC